MPNTWEGQNVITLDLEIERPPGEVEGGWSNLAGLGLAVGCYFDYQAMAMEVFDKHTLVDTIEMITARQPMMISFNGCGFDFPLMQEIARTELHYDKQWILAEFAHIADGSFDILREVWTADPATRYQKGNSLQAFLASNNLPTKTGSGDQAPIFWRQGRIADVVNYCMQDVRCTSLLAELASVTHGRLSRTMLGPVVIHYLGPMARAGLVTPS